MPDLDKSKYWQNEDAWAVCLGYMLIINCLIICFHPFPVKYLYDLDLSIEIIELKNKKSIQIITLAWFQANNSKLDNKSFSCSIATHVYLFLFTSNKPHHSIYLNYNDSLNLHVILSTSNLFALGNGAVVKTFRCFTNTIFDCVCMGLPTNFRFLETIMKEGYHLFSI